MLVADLSFSDDINTEDLGKSNLNKTRKRLIDQRGVN